MNYNENKVKEGKAVLIAATNYHKDGDQLSFVEKFQRLQHLADLHEEREHRCIHVSLNFDPSEKLSARRLAEIADAYMQKFGYGSQPYLVYQHFDAAHTHIHIVSTTIRSDGSPIQLHNNWKDSKEARLAVEQEFGLIPAESRKQKEIYQLRPIDLRKVIYGKSETKSSIANIVRTIVANYKFTSLAELNAVLRQYNVIADRGEPGTRMYERGGLVYSLVDNEAKKIGVPIKASTIYSSPTLKKLEEKFPGKKEARKNYRERVRMLIDDALKAGVIGKSGFTEYLKEHGIHVIFRKNAEGQTYGVTYVDNKTRCVFNGSDLSNDKAYSAKGILERLAGSSASDLENVKGNRDFVNRVTGDTDYAPGFNRVLADWAKRGLLVDAKTSFTGNTIYSMGNFATGREHYVPAGGKLSRYFAVNGYTEHAANLIYDELKDELARGAEQLAGLSLDVISRIIDAALQPANEGNFVDYRWMRKPEKKRKRRR